MNTDEEEFEKMLSTQVKLRRREELLTMFKVFEAEELPEEKGSGGQPPLADDPGKGIAEAG